MQKETGIKPVHEKILVKPFPTEETTPGGLYIPGTAQERPSKATVMAVGNGIENRPMELKVDDIVYHVKGAGILIKDKGEDYYILRDVDVLCILPKED